MVVHYENLKSHVDNKFLHETKIQMRYLELK